MRRRRLRSRLKADASRPRLLVRKSLKHMTGILIDDVQGRVIFSVTSGSPACLKELGAGEKAGGGGAKAKVVGTIVAAEAQKLGYKKVVFDRGGYAYHGLVKAMAEAARAGGLEF